MIVTHIFTLLFMFSALNRSVDLSERWLVPRNAPRTNKDCTPNALMTGVPATVSPYMALIEPGITAWSRRICRDDAQYHRPCASSG